MLFNILFQYIFYNFLIANTNIYIANYIININKIANLE